MDLIQPFPAFLNRVVLLELSSFLLGTGLAAVRGFRKSCYHLSPPVLSFFPSHSPPLSNENLFELMVNYTLMLIYIVGVLSLLENILQTSPASWEGMTLPCGRQVQYFRAAEMFGRIFWCSWHCTTSAATLLHLSYWQRCWWLAPWSTSPLRTILGVLK